MQGNIIRHFPLAYNNLTIDCVQHINDSRECNTIAIAILDFPKGAGSNPNHVSKLLLRQSLFLAISTNAVNNDLSQLVIHVNNLFLQSAIFFL